MHFTIVVIAKIGSPIPALKLAKHMRRAGHGPRRRHHLDDDSDDYKQYGYNPSNVHGQITVMMIQSHSTNMYGQDPSMMMQGNSMNMGYGQPGMMTQQQQFIYPGMNNQPTYGQPEAYDNSQHGVFQYA